MNEFNFSVEDINKQTARNAFYNTSFDPDRRGDNIRLEYADHMQSTFNKLSKLAETEEQKTILVDEMNRYKVGYVSRLTAYLYSQSRCASSMITGFSNFPVERNRKKMNAAHNKYQELLEFSEKAQKSICKKLSSARTEKQVNNEEYERLLSVFNRYMEWNKGEYLVAYQVTSLTDKIKRSFNNGNYEAVKMILEYIQERQKDLKKPYITNRHSIWNLLKTEIIDAKQETVKTGEELVQEFSDVKIVNNYNDERVRIFFPGKPSAEVISLLKKSAWKWSPFNKAWQRKNTKDALYSANRIIEELQKLEVA